MPVGSHIVNLVKGKVTAMAVIYLLSEMAGIMPKGEAYDPRPKCGWGAGVGTIIIQSLLSPIERPAIS